MWCDAIWPSISIRLLAFVLFFFLFFIRILIQLRYHMARRARFSPLTDVGCCYEPNRGLSPSLTCSDCFIRICPLTYSVLYIGVRCRGRKQKRASASIVTPASPLWFCIAVTRPFDEQRSYATTPRRICRSLSHPWSAKHQWCPQLAITIISITVVAIIIITSASTNGMDDQRHEYVWVVLSI